MLQPFVKLQQPFIDKLVELKKYYLVAQSYARNDDHFSDTKKQGILLSDYDDEGLAKIHLNAVSHDKYACILDLRKAAHYKKLQAMMLGDQYELFWCIVKSAAALKKKLDAGYKGKIRNWIEKNTHWDIKASESVLTQFEVRFGELFLILKWRTQKASLKFEEIERT
ncbi:MAG: hypothetical protein H7X88_00560 [Gloeobacteraceae cyanobacterium ES-bin-316]|nr:hypothetical protein [Ferruginibacter sp.]